MTAAFVLAGALVLETRLRLSNALHPVAWLGTLAGALIRRAPRAPKAAAFEAGLAIAVLVPSAVYVAAHLAFRALAPWPFAQAVLQTLALYTSISLFGLLDAARVMQRALPDDLMAARAGLSALCSRDPSALDASGLANGTIESLAENLSDAVVAPLFALALFGVEGALAYRAINTLDAMIGYRGEYEWLGKAAARIDDIANLVPARLTALLLLLAGATLRSMSVARGVRVWRRDRALTESPNGGHAMAMAAGLLGLTLDKPGAYVLGAGLARPEPSDIPRAIALVRRAGLFAFALALACVVHVGLLGCAGLYGTH
jgi:adenosylcobinamide-phosphate synthase